MSNELSPQLLAQIFAQESNDPYLVLFTLTHASFSTIRLVNNSTNITSRGNVFQAFPVRVNLPVDDGQTAREVTIDFDNVSLELIDAIRTVTTQIDVKMEMILASMPDEVQMSLEELKITDISYNKLRISARLFMDSFLSTEMTSEKYNPSNFPGIFG